MPPENVTSYKNIFYLVSMRISWFSSLKRQLQIKSCVAGIADPLDTQRT